MQRCVAAGALAGLAVTEPLPVAPHHLALLLEAIDIRTDVRGLFPDLDARLAELAHAQLTDGADPPGLTALGRVILDAGLVQTSAGTWAEPPRRPEPDRP